MKEDYVHKDSLTALGYYDFAKTQSIKDNILEDTKDYGRIQFIDEICRLQRENQQLKNALEEYKNPIKYFKYANKNVTEENKQLKEQLLVTQDNEETFRLEMEDITQTLGLDEDTLFDDVKAYAGSLKNNWNKLKEYVTNEPILDFYNDKLPFEIIIKKIKDKMQELEGGCD